MKPTATLLVLVWTGMPAMRALDLADFGKCIGASGTASTCQLDPNPSPPFVWVVDTTLTIARSNLLIEGTVGDPSDVILQRSPTLGAMPIMNINANLIATVTYLTFDGNRQNVNLCSPSNSAIGDLDLWDAGIATVQYVDFIDAPWKALQLGGSLGNTSRASTVSYSNFGQGFSAHGITRTAQQSASRWEGVILQGPYAGVWSNNIAYTGLEAVQIYSGTDRYVVDNVVNVGKYEQPDGVSGGVIYIAGNNVFYASIANNVLNGNYWSTSNAQDTNPSGANYTLCLPHPGLWTFGIETSGNGHRYYNNSIIQNLGYGIILRPWNSSSTLNNNIISGWDPFCTGSCTFVPHYVQNNGGCWTLYSCYGSGWPSAYRMAGISVSTQTASGGPGTGTVSNLTLDHVRSVSNSRHGVSFDSVTGTPGFIDSVNGYNYACIENNGSVNLVSTNSSSPYNAYTNLCP